MIRLATTALAIGDVIRTSNGTEGTVTWMPKNRDGRFWVEIDLIPESMRDCGSVELLSDLGSREAVKSFGRW